MRVLIFLLIFVLLSPEFRAQVLINEFLSSNISGIHDEDDEHSDWIELYNYGSSALNLGGYSLTDELADTTKWTFPECTVAPYSHTLVFASGKNRRTYAATYYTIIDVGDHWKYYVPVTDIGTVWHKPDFNDSGWNEGPSGFGYGDDDDATILNAATSIFLRKKFTINNIDDIRDLILCVDYDDGFVAYINEYEVARANLGKNGELIKYDRLADRDREALIYQGGSPEYFNIDRPDIILNEGENIITIQVHNNVTTSSDLTLIPFLTIGRTTAGTDDVSSYLSFDDYQHYHTNFKLDADGESFYLFSPAGNLVDSCGAICLLDDISYGRKPDGNPAWYYFGEPTPGAANSTAGVVEYMGNPVSFSPIGGKHPGGVTVTLSTKNPADTIYYTTDGSNPEEWSQRYTGPIYIGASQVIKARVLKHNILPGQVCANTYVTNLDHDLPIVCLSTDPYNLWDNDYGIFAFGPNYETSFPYFGANFWQDWERPVYVELFDTQGSKKLDQGAGIKVFGGWSRGNDQKSVALFARREYGKGSFRYKIFSDKPIEEFESVVLRNSGNDNMGLQFHDCFMTGLTRNMNIDRQAFQPAAAYINGEYWGLLNIREKVNVNYIAENHLVDPDSVNLLENEGYIIDGTNTDYLRIIDFLNTHTTLQDNTDYNWVRSKIDLDNFIQYQLTEIYLNNRDWPGNNIKFWNTLADDSKWRWILFDTDFGFGIWNTADYQANTVEFALYPYGTGWPNPAWSTLFLRRMVSNSGFRNYFIIQFCDRLNLDFHPSRIISDLDSLQTVYDNEIVYHFNRWWGSYEEWLNRIENHKIFGLYRPDYCRQHLDDEFSLGQELEISIDVSDNAAGRVELNTICPKEYPFTGIYFEDIPITMTAIPREGYKFVRWEGTVNSTDRSIQYNMEAAGSFKAVFAEATIEDISIVINEINYNSSPERDTKDWVELVNNGISTVDLNGWLLSDSGPDSGYFFQEGTILVPGQYLVICRDLGDFRDFNQGVSNSVGDMPFGLSSNGDMLRLYDDQSHVMDAVDYYVYNPWPENANGTGASIELKDPSLDNTLGENWQAVGIGGTPGKANHGVLDIHTPGTVDLFTSSFDCYPNPFRDYSTIEFSVSTDGNYRLEVIDIHGSLIKVLADGYLPEGTYWLDWEGTDHNGQAVKAGFYTLRLVSENSIQTKKIIKLN